LLVGRQRTGSARHLDEKENLKMANYDAHSRESPYKPEPPKNPQHPGMRKSNEWLQARFFDINRWRKTAKGDLSMEIEDVRGDEWRIVIYQRKKSPSYGWMRTNLRTDVVVSADGCFADRQAVAEDARKWLGR
jgi:hypothetical protein